MKTALLWLRRDLRLTDNPALAAALGAAGRVVPVYIHAAEEEGAWAPGAAARWWLHHSLARLGESLAGLGAPLVIRKGDSLAELRKLVQQSGAGAVYWNRLYEPALIERDRRIEAALREDGLEARSFNAALLLEPWELKTGGGEPYRVFTPYWKNAQARLPQHAIHRQPKTLASHELSGASLESLELLPKLPWADGFSKVWTPGEQGAATKLARFCDEALIDYRVGRDFPALQATSALSPHLHFGEISPQQLFARLQAQRQDAGLHANAEHFLRELGWREFAHHLLFHYPKTPQAPLYEKFERLPWRQPREYAGDLRRWQRGQTGIPIVDAGMRQLWSTGWMHNRVRMIAASWLTKNLLIPWQEGAAWFWDTLVDADLANNTLGWQWVAGCGADAAPYFRVFNPVLQAGKFDRAGEYVRHFVPELRKLPDAALHAPWLAGPDVLQAARVQLGITYPLPQADLGVSRARALAAYARIKAG